MLYEGHTLISPRTDSACKGIDLRESCLSDGPRSIKAADSGLIHYYKGDITVAVYGAEIAFVHKLHRKIDGPGDMPCGKLLVSPQINRNCVGVIDEICRLA